MVWDPKRIKPQSWDEVIAFYRHLEDRNDDFRPLRALVEHVAAQPYASALSAAVSGTALLVTRRAGADFARDGLRIDVGLSASIRFVRPRRGDARPTTIEIENPTARTLATTFERLLENGDWG